ncbi:hypothetical protein BSZ39_09000 [Bowdeniella nasicola]|uniref:Amidohydrolase-related domain-containing protein n=1 Tax=Bowdeniella nasicola TaxID=208480 RepID=A0A1Q5Q1S0_9ACTO|nr:amidohydrolase family protein [Bowdeniella nasicola]OKL53540.1 hypothetical protein BSZ39_09000 [Bowdeniella nasicola]
MARVVALAGRVVLNSGEHVDRAWLVDGRLSLADPFDDPSDAAAGVVQELVGWFYPGLVDVHCHIGLGDAGPVDEETALAQGRADLAAGTLLVRDCGVQADTHWLDRHTDVPVIVRAGQHIARPKRYLRNLAVELDDPSQLPEEVARQARAGDGWVKIVADWIDRSAGADAVVAPLWDPAVLADAIAAAHEAGARVTAHTFSTEAIGALLDAGIDCLEHGSGMQDEHIAEAARRAIPVTPTLVQSDNFADFADAGGARFPAYAAQMRWLHERRFALLRRFLDAGVQILAGSYAGGSLAHGTLPRELGLWVDAGLDAHAALEFASWRARAYLASGPGSAGERAGRTGLVDGELADVVHYADDPADLLAAGALSPMTVIRTGEVVTP